MNMIRNIQHEEVMTVIGKPKPTKKPKKKSNPPMDKEKYLAYRASKGWSLFCDSGVNKQGDHMHHCLIGRRKGYPILDDYRNIVWVNSTDHLSRKFDNTKWRKFFWYLQCRRYGRSAMIEWINEVKTMGLHKSRVDWI